MVVIGDSLSAGFQNGSLLDFGLIANQYIGALNASTKSEIAKADVSAVAADPLFGPNIKPSGKVSIPLNAARRTDALIKGCKAGCF
jgi:hypothetical protein